MAASASRTSSSLKGLMIAMTIFMGFPPLEPVPGVAGSGTKFAARQSTPAGYAMKANQAACQIRAHRVATFTCLERAGCEQTQDDQEWPSRGAARRPLSARLVDPPTGEDHAGHHRLAGRLLDDQPNAWLGTREDHLDAVPALHFRHTLADQDGREARIADELLGVGVVDVLAVEAHPHPDQPLGLAANLRGRHDEEGPRFINSDDALFLLDVLRRVGRIHRDDLRLGVGRQLFLRARSLKI